MKALILIFIFLLVAVLLGIAIHADSGYVLVVYQHWSIETTLWFALFSILLLYVVVYVVGRIIGGTWRLSGRFRRWSSKRHQLKAQQLTNQGLCQLAEGRWKQAETSLLKAAKNNDTALINYLAAARAAQYQDAFERRDLHLKHAAEHTKQAEVAIGLTQAQLQLQGNQYEQALATLRHLNQLAPHHVYILKLLQQVYIELNDWVHLQQCLPELKKRKILPSQQLTALEIQATIGLLHEATKSLDRQALTQVWQQVPHALKSNQRLVLAYSHCLLQAGFVDAAEQLLREGLKKQWHADWLDQYGKVAATDAKNQLKSAEGWLRAHADDAALLRCLGRLAVRNHLWEKAESYLETSVKLKACADTYVELAKVLVQLGEKDRALAVYQKLVEL